MDIRKIMSLVETLIPAEQELDESEPFLVTAVKHLPTGKIYRGEIGQLHHDVAEDNGLFGVGWKHNPDLETGFINHKGHFLTRARALEYAKEHDLLHDMAKRYIAMDDTPAELGASFLKPQAARLDPTTNYEDTLVRESEEIALHSAKMVGGSTIFSVIPMNETFSFPKSDAVLTKVGPTRYKDEQGRTFKTSKHTAVNLV